MKYSSFETFEDLDIILISVGDITSSFFSLKGKASISDQSVG